MTPYLDIFHAVLVPEHDFQNKYYSKQNSFWAVSLLKYSSRGIFLRFCEIFKNNFL